MLKYRFTSIKHTFLRSEELAKKTGRWETFQTPRNGSYNKPQFSADPDTHVFECEKKLAPLCGEMRANFGHQKRIRPNVLTKHQCRARGNPPNRIFATAGHCSVASKCVSKGLLPETAPPPWCAACVRSRSLAEIRGFDFAIPKISESVTRTKRNLPYIYIYILSY